MTEVVAFLLVLALLRLLLRLPFGRSDRVTFRFRVPLRYRYPRLWRAAVAFGLLVVLPVGWLGSSCGWWGP